MIRRFFLLFSFLAIFGLGTLPAFACTCSKEPPGTCPGLQTDDVVFTGTVIGIEVLPAPPAPASDAAGANGDTANASQEAPTPITRSNCFASATLNNPTPA